MSHSLADRAIMTNDVDCAIGTMLPYLLVGEPHPWPLGLIMVYLTPDDPAMFGVIEMHNGKRMPLCRRLSLKLPLLVTFEQPLSVTRIFGPYKYGIV